MLILFLNPVCQGRPQLHNPPIVEERIPSYSQDFLYRPLEQAQGNWMERTRLKLQRVVRLSLFVGGFVVLTVSSVSDMLCYSACFAVNSVIDPLRLTTTASECFFLSVTKLYC